MTSDRQRRGERGASPAFVVLAGLVAGALSGFVLERTGVVDPLGEPAPAVVRIDRITAFDCPDGAPIAELARGDQVLATARSQDGEWTEIRSPLGVAQAVWVRTDGVAPDPASAIVGDLPSRGCQLTGPTTTTSSSSTSTSSTSSTSSTTSTTSTTIPTSTTPPPNTPPLIATFKIEGRASTLPPPSTTSTTSGGSTSTSVPDGPYQYVHAVPERGQPACPTETRLTVQVADPQGLASVVVTWDTDRTTGGSSGDVVLTDAPEAGIDWIATFTFPSTAVPTGDEVRQPTFTVTARDNLGAVSTLVVAPPASTFRVFGAEALPCDR